MTQPKFDYQTFLKHLTTSPGVYRMLDTSGVVLYVGKANNLKQRVSSYFNNPASSVKNKALVTQIAAIEVSVTRSETEALLLESSLIKALRPKYNVLMRDDKTYPFIHLSAHQSYPRISIIRSKQKPQSGEYFGPYPSAMAVRETIQMIQKIFKIRPCTDAYFNTRSRPCLQYQIKRCSAPCTKYIDVDAYQHDLMNARLFLQGKNQQILDELGAQMQIAVKQLAFESAAILRDQIKKLRLVQEQQGVVHTQGTADVIAIELNQGFACVQLVSVRDGQIVAHENFFPKLPNLDLDPEELWQHVFAAFVQYFYFAFPERIPPLLITQHVVVDVITMQQALSELAGFACKIKSNPRGIEAKWLDFACNNLKHAVSEQINSKQILTTRYQALQDFLKLEHKIKRMECFDISHIQGQFTVASCVVFDNNGPCKKSYRSFNIQNITPGDDCAAMQQALTRHFKRLSENAVEYPDVLVIDGGIGQWRVAHAVLENLNINKICIVGISKGPTRKAGLEKLIVGDSQQLLTLPEHSPALHLLQHIRDESHRFAITAHRKKRNKASISSSLISIPGIGKKRYQALLLRFGGLRELALASVDEIAKVRGISAELAQNIYQHYHSQEN
jgi:excinuclease ABC subunit C